MNTGPTPVARVARVRRWWGERGVLASVVATTAPSLVLTFDDGPDPANTPRVLEVLRDRGASATFFVLMTRVRREPRLLAELMAAGHEVGLQRPIFLIAGPCVIESEQLQVDTAGTSGSGRRTVPRRRRPG